MLCQFLFSGGHVQQLAFEKFDTDWMTLTAYGDVTIKEFGVRVIKGSWNNENMETSLTM